MLAKYRENEIEREREREREREGKEKARRNERICEIQQVHPR